MRSTLGPLTIRITLDPLEAHLRDNLINALKLFGAGCDIPSLQIQNQGPATFSTAMREVKLRQLATSVARRCQASSGGEASATNTRSQGKRQEIPIKGRQERNRARSPRPPPAHTPSSLHRSANSSIRLPATVPQRPPISGPNWPPPIGTQRTQANASAVQAALRLRSHTSEENRVSERRRRAADPIANSWHIRKNMIKIGARGNLIDRLLIDERKAS